MKTLPATTKPAPERIRRRHVPKPLRYQKYRNCLRWEFSFCCAFCLLHEADLAPSLGSEGLGLFSAEHFDPVSVAPQRRHEYANLFYACRLCNGNRGSAPVSIPGARLLNPCESSWAEHFEAEEDQLNPRSADPDAVYTAGPAGYDLNDPRKVEVRKVRREKITECLDLIQRGYKVIASLLAKGDDPERVSQAGYLFDCIRRAKKDLGRYRAIPPKAPDQCRCRPQPTLALREWLEAQTLELEL